MQKLKQSPPTRKLLVVDDDLDIRTAIKLALIEQDYVDFDVREAANLPEAVRSIQNDLPDLIILDLHLGKDDTGFHFMEELVKDGRLNPRQVIMLTADDNINTLLEASKKGIEPFHFIGKPFNITDLQALALELSLESAA